MKYEKLIKYAEKHGIDIKNVSKDKKAVIDKYKDKKKEKKLTLEDRVARIEEYLRIDDNDR